MDVVAIALHPSGMATIELDDLELIEAARGQRALRERALADARQQQSPSVRAIFEQSAAEHERLEAKFEAARVAPIVKTKPKRKSVT